MITEDSDAYRILLVEDDEVDRLAVHRALRSAGPPAAIRDVADVASALDALAGESFDCVLLDYNLPGGDGLKVLSEARRADRDVPVVMLTGQQDAETVVQLMKSGASDYLFKGGLEPERLAQAVRQAVRVHRAERKAREAELWFRTVQETSPDGFLVLRSVRDEGGEIRDFRVEYANPAAGRIAAREPQELLNMHLLQVHPGLLQTDLFQLYRHVVHTGESRQLETHYVHEGYDLWLRITAVRLGDGVALGLGDISERKRAEQAREEALATRSRFYAVMSHELRTPINAILGYNDLILAGVYGPLEEGLEESIQRSQRATRHLLELVNDVLDLSKLEAGKMEVVPEEVNMADLLDELLATVRPLAEERGTEITVSAESCRRPIITDPRRVRQIVLNLVSNAIKFGEGKPVQIHCASAGDGGVQLEVVDFGKGIPAEDLPRVFDEFVQLPSAVEGGTGLGLPISKRLAELLGGELDAESSLGAGSVFRLCLPSRHASLAAEATVSAT